MNLLNSAADSIGTVIAKWFGQKLSGRYSWLRPLIFILTIVSTGVGAASIKHLQDRLVHASGETLELAAAETAEKLDRFLVERFGDIQLVARAFATQMMNQDFLADYLAEMRTAYPSYLWIGATDAKGRIIAATDPTTIGQNVSTSDWFQAVHRERSIHVKDVEPARLPILQSGSMDTITFTAPILSERGDFLGVVSAQIATSAIENVLVHTIRSIQDRDGFLETLQSQVITEAGNAFIDSNLMHKGRVNLKRLRLPSALLSEQHLKGYIEEEDLRRHVPVITGYASTQGFAQIKGLRWTILLRMDRSHILAPIHALAWKMAIGGVLVWSPMLGLLLWSIGRLKREWTQVQHERDRATTMEEVYRLLLDSTSEAIYGIDRDGRCTFINKSGASLLGYQSHELLGRNMHEAIHHSYPNGSSYPVEACPLYGALRTGQGCRVDSEVLWHRDGTSFAAEYSARPLVVEETINGAVAVFNDITQRKHAELRLKESEQTYRELVDSLEAIVWEADLPTLRVSYISPQVERFLGYTPKQWLTQSITWTDVIHPDDQTSVFATCQQETDAGRNHTMEYRMKAADGRVVWVRDIITVIASNGRPVKLRGVIVDITERKQMEERLTSLAYHDPLTDLPNRRLFADRLQTALTQAQRRKDLLAVVLIDLDNFKLVNDSLGHDVGDQLLKEVAVCLKETVRESDTLARLGGDEFAVLLANIRNREDAGSVARKLVQAFSRTFTVDGRELVVTPSVGISLFPDDGTDAISLLRSADMAMYEVKAHGRNAYQFSTPALMDRTRTRLALEMDLRKAIDRHEFQVHYQPQVSLTTGRIVGMEALIRWQHPTRGLVSPAQFLPLAEETGLIVPIGTWVLHTACAQAKRWNQEGYGPLRVAVNFSARQFHHPDLAQQVQQVLATTGLEPSSLDMELTESLVMDGAERIGKILGILKQLGLTLSMDDFGTGYSSLSYLKNLPLNILKIDRSFVGGIEKDARDEAIVQMVIDMAHSLNLLVIAEGVETRTQADFLRAHRCDQFQGYLFSPPVPAEMFERMLKENKCLDQGRAEDRSHDERIVVEQPITC